VLLVKGPKGTEQLNDPEKGVVYGGPLVILASRFSASASEILAGTLQDYGRALIVGDTATHGKGTVQRIFDLGAPTRSKLGALKLTIQQFYRVNGESTQATGISSDIVIPSLSEFAAPSEKDSEYALIADEIQSADHAKLNMVPPELRNRVKELSAKRINESKDFAKLAKDIELLKARKARKSISLNEKEIRALFTKEEAEKAEQKLDDPEEKLETGAFKFKRNFINNEILKITEDFVVQGKK
jgi:carboxyl-terminal processing protease